MSKWFQQRRWFDGRRAADTPLAIVRLARWNFAVLVVPVVYFAAFWVWRSIIAAQLKGGALPPPASIPTSAMASMGIMAFVPCAIFTIVFVVRVRISLLRRRARRADGLACESCVYDLHGLASDGSCPECGMTYRIEELKRLWDGAERSKA